MRYFDKALPSDFARFSVLLALAMAGVVGGAWVFQFLGYVPCQLCLQQREPYYLGVPIALLAALFAVFRPTQPVFARGLIAICALLMAYGIYLSAYHSGVEWAWWAGPAECGAAVHQTSSNASDLFASLDNIKPPACDEAAGRFLGLSFAGWNFVASLFLSLAGAKLAFKN